MPTWAWIIITPFLVIGVMTVAFIVMILVDDYGPKRKKSAGEALATSRIRRSIRDNEMRLDPSLKASDIWKDG